MEPIEESTTLSPKESIVNILGRLFNNGHISGDELAMMQMELVARNPAPAPEPVELGDVLQHSMFQDLLRRTIQANEEAERLRRQALTAPMVPNPFGAGGIASSPYRFGTTTGDDLLNAARLSQYANADTLTPIDLMNGHTKI